ncbi:MAG: sigma-54 interaction domain-containing protein [bacterium]
MLEYHKSITTGAATFFPLGGDAATVLHDRRRPSQSERNGLPQPLVDKRVFDNLLGLSAEMQMIFKLIAQVAATDVAVLVQGETGTGKELVARAIHNHSLRNHKPFVAVNCAALSETLLESELFGHERGAFTGALERKLGRFELADGGTIFLDEIGEIPPPTQIKFLRVLQERAFERVGGAETIRSNFRIIAATNRNLKAAMQEGRFREDLYYRLNVVPVRITPLRQRKDDIPLLVRHFVEKYAQRYHKPAPEIAPSAMKMLLDHSWPGNVRELENVIERALIMCAGASIEANHLLHLEDDTEVALLSQAVQQHLPEAELTKLYARLIFNEQNGNKKEACRILGINFRTLQNRLGVHDPVMHAAGRSADVLE